ncbi:MAG: hypothetical protein ACFFDL_04990 [Promethearchaeota archaeon]
MKVNKKVSSLLITAILFLSIIGIAIAYTSDFTDFSGEGHNSCHGDITQSASGYISLSSSSGTTVNPSETFTISIQVLSFTEAQGKNIETGFPSGTPGRGDNKDFTFDAIQKSASIDSSGNSITIDFQATAPTIEQTYTLTADAIYREGSSASYFATGNLIITVEPINTPPQFNNLIESADPLELGQQENIQIDVTDSESSVSDVLIELENINYTMSNILGNTYEYNWTPNTIGIKNYIIFANDTEGSWNKVSGNINVIDITAPILSNLVESADPLELGQTEVIQINATDLSGISQVLIEIGGVNYTMVNIGGPIWEYNSWTPTSTGLKPYIIYANDTEGNWNSLNDDVTVDDTIAPKYSNLIENADPLPLGQNETISIEIYDSPGSGVKEVLIEYDGSNHTMIFIGFNTWRWSNWKPMSVGIFNYFIYMVDNSNNVNITGGSIEVIISTGPTIQNLSKSADPLELGKLETIQVDVDDTNGVSNVFIEIGGLNYSMVNIGGIRYEFTWKPNSTGIKLFKIYANDSLNNWNQFGNSIFVQDTKPPNFGNLTESSDPVELGAPITISIDTTDLSGINQVKIEFEGVNHSMSYTGGNTWLNDTLIFSTVDIHLYTIYIQDNSNNWNTTNGFIEVIDTTPPVLTNLYESSDPLELGQIEVIQIDIIDLAPINTVLIEFEGKNYTMVKISSLTWEYNWVPTSTGLKLYTIYANDTSNNWISLVANISVVDTNGPVLSALYESADQLELGQTETIQINVSDPSGINQVVIEIGGENYTMQNIGGSKWEYSWAPNSTGLKLYTLYAYDSINNTVSLKNNITVIDTTGPIFSNLVKSKASILLGESVSIQIEVVDISGVSEVLIEFSGSNHTLINTEGNTWEYTDWFPSSIGENSFTIHAKDNLNNWNTVIGNILVTEQSVGSNLLTMREILDITLFSSIFGITIFIAILIIRTARNKRFIQ